MLRFLILVIVAGVLAAAALTKPSRADLEAAAAKYADGNSLLSSLAAHVTGVFGYDKFDDYIFFDRYRIYVGQNSKVDCIGAFGATSCNSG